MGNRSARRTNEMLGEQTGIARRQAARMGEIGEEERAFGTGLRDEVLSGYRSMLGEYGDGGGEGGGGGWAFNLTAPKMNESMEGYRKFANTGGFTPEEASEYRSRGTATLPAYYDSLREELATQNAGAGGYSVGFTPQMAKLAREKGRGASEAALGAETELSSMIRKNKLLGLEGVGRWDKEYQDAMREYEMAVNANNRAAASDAAGRANNAYRERMSILGEMGDFYGRAGSDLPYWALEQAGGREGRATIEGRVEETPWWQQALQVAVPAASSFFSGGLSGLGSGRSSRAASRGGGGRGNSRYEGGGN